MILRIVILFLAGCFVSLPALAQQDSFPYLGEITSHQVNVRAGQSSNFERLVRLDENEAVVVVGREFSWLKIRLPHSVNVYANSKYMQVIDSSHAQVLVDRLNVRAKADTNSTILGQLEKSDIVIVREIKGEWITIEPTAKVFGWISEEFVKFTSQNIPQDNTVAVLAKNEPQVPVLTAPSPEIISEFVSTAGIVEAVKEGEAVRYKITDDQNKEYRLTIDESLIKPFLHYKVSLEGKLQPPSSDITAPVLIISNIRLVL